MPLPRFNRSQPGNIFRIFEKGGFEPLQLGIPTLDEPPGKPERRLSPRGLGTLNRTDPIFLGAQKTRLHDPLLGFMGSNDRPGDYRSQRLHRLPRGLCERSLADELRLVVASSATRG